MAGLPVSEAELRAILVTDLEIISEDDFQQARVMARRLRVPIERAIVERARVPYRFLLEQLAVAWGVEFIDLKVSDVTAGRDDGRGSVAHGHVGPTPGFACVDTNPV